MKRTKRSKLLAALLAITMVMTSLLPTVVFAEDTTVSSEEDLKAAISAATGTETNPTTIDISADFTIQSAINIPAGKYVFINGNNHTISRADDSTNYVTSGKLTVDTHAMFYIEGYAKLTNLTIDAKGDETHLLRAFVVNGGTADVYLGDGKITGAYSTTSAGGALVAIGGTVNFYSGELSNNTATCGAALLGDKAGTINMYGGKIVTNNSNLTLSTVFQNCAGITEIAIPAHVTTLDRTFMGCTGLTTVTIPETVESYVGAFNGCTGLTNAVIKSKADNIGGSNTNIATGVFGGCINLKTVSVPKWVKVIGMSAFRGCSSLETTDFIEQATIIKSQAFQGCTSLKGSLNLSASTIESFAFDKCSNLGGNIK